MRVDKVNFYTYSPKNNNLGQRKIVQNNDLVVFKGEEKPKPTFMDRIKGVFSKEKIETSKEYEKSEEIKYFLGDINALAKELQKEGRLHYLTLKNMLAIGKYYDYRGYVDLSRSDNEKIVYGRIDEETGLPKTVTHMDFSSGMDVIKSYELIDGLNMYTINDCHNKNFDIVMNGGGKKIRYYKERERATGETKELIITSKGFMYFEGTTDWEGNRTETKYDIDFKHDESERSTFIEQNEDGELVRYAYNQSTDLWEKECIVEFN